MPRRGPLLELSREHHAALVLARDCRAATPADVDAVRERIFSHHHAVLVTHFAREEALLEIHAGGVGREVSARILDDHAWMRAWVAAGDHGLADIRAYGDRIAQHVRFEERVAWPLLQPLVEDPRGPA